MVYGPKEHFPKFETSQEKAIIKCRYHMTPFSVTERKSPKPSRREIELSKIIKEALEPAIITEKFPETGIDVFIEVLQADGSTRVASINAASLALADAGLPMRDLIAACSAGKVNGHIVLDIGEKEDKEGEADVPVAIIPNLNRITLLQMDGILTHKEFKKTVELAISGARKFYETQVNVLKEKIEKMKVLEE
jgi:exosome complex component RRP41